MKKSRFTIVLLCGIFSLVFLAAVEIIWAVDTYKNMRNAYRNQIESIFEEATWQYVTRFPNGDYTLPNIERLHTILKEELRTSGLECQFMISILAPIGDNFEPIWEISNESLSERKIDFNKSFPPLTIRLTVDDPHTTIIASMRLIAILQMLSIVVLTITFIYLLRTLFRAKSLEQMRRDLTHNITHELKTPIAAAYAATDALRTSPSFANNEVKRNEYLDLSLQSLKRLEDMVEEILRSSTEEFEQRKLNYTQCDVGEIVEEICATIDLKYQAREVRWNIDIPHSTEIVADRLHIAAMMSALVDNAIKYCSKQPHITITASSSNTSTIISISDNGAGIPISERKRIFEKFYRISQGNRHDTKGFGLGLYYVKNIIELHRGKISLRSTVGKGSTFEITLPAYGKTTNTNS
ncbi:MAG: HAMP domain-containing histidine kinase [Alistipes sp.]|nr:HAMP domain-containing histidine kinase [Alistipes sp.]